MSPSTSDSVHVGVYGEVNANLLDGSSIWLQSICLTLAALSHARVTLLLRAPLERDLVVAPLLRHPRIEVVEPTRWLASGMLTPLGAIGALGSLDAEDHFDYVVLRGAAAADAAAMHGGFDGRILLYHVPVEGDDGQALARNALGAHRVLCQTEAIRERIASDFPNLAERTVILPPMIPGSGAAPRRSSPGLKRLVYAGKISPEYFGLEMVELLGRLRAEVPGVELHVAGDKIHNPPADPSFRERAREVLEGTEGLVWHGGLRRDEVAELLEGADVALSLRHSSLDDSLEMSTKVLEYGAAGCAVLLNPTPAHIERLGDDYPLLASSVDEALEALLTAAREPAVLAAAAERVAALSQDHSFEAVAARIGPHLEGGSAPVPAPMPSHSPTKLLIAGHSFGFAESLVQHASEAGTEVRKDRWSAHGRGDEEASAEALGWANVILCEWCLGNAVWYSRNVRRDQTLAVRFHRMELETRYPAEVDLDRVDAMVFVARHVLESACEKFGWPLDAPCLQVVPNAIDVEALRLPKLPGAEFTLGMLGFVPWVKRLDRALEILERLRARDDRFRLIVKGRGPWEYDWMGARERERREYERAFARIERSPALRQAVVFESYGDDVPHFLQQVGWVISTSDIEGHSVALAEGMASGAVPVVIERPGARAQYAAGWVHDDPEGAARAVHRSVTGGGMAAESTAAMRAAARWSWARIAPEWERILRLAP